MEIVTIDTDTIKLAQLLKLTNAVGSGAEAKLRIQNGEVRVNSKVETRRGRKLQIGDTVEYANSSYVLVRKRL